MQKQKTRLINRRLSELYANGALDNIVSYNCLIRLYWDTYESELASYEQAPAESITRAFRRMLDNGQFKMGDSFEKRRKDIAAAYAEYYGGKEEDPMVFTGPDYATELTNLNERTSASYVLSLDPVGAVPSHLGGIRIED